MMKVVMGRRCGLAALRGAVHLVPCTGALFLVALNSAEFYIGGELSGATGQDPEKLAALQFAAKVHELFMIASLGAVLLTYVRKELAFGDRIPLGAVFSAHQFQRSSFLWSASTWGIVYQQWQKRRKNCFIVSLVAACSLLGLSVGLASAMLMRPRLAEWPAGGTPFWVNTTEALLFPRRLDGSRIPPGCATLRRTEDNGGCISSGWETLNELHASFWPQAAGLGSIPERFLVPGRYSERVFETRIRNVGGRERLIWGNAYTLATVPILPVSDSVAELGRLWSFAAANDAENRLRYRQDVLFTAQSRQPIVFARCRQLRLGPGMSATFPVLSVTNLQTGPGTGDSGSGGWANVAEFAPWSSPELDRVRSTTTSQPSLLWIDDSRLMQSLNSSIALVATFPESRSLPRTSYCCSIDCKLADTRLVSTRGLVKQVSGTPSNFATWGTFWPGLEQIKLSSSWARYLNPILGERNDGTAVFSAMSRTAGLWNASARSDSVYSEVIVEDILAMLVANGVARSSNTAALLMALKDVADPTNPWAGGAWQQELLPRKGMGEGGNAFDVPVDNQTHFTQFQLSVKVKGYAYSSKGITQKLAMAVLSAYIVLAASHFIYSAWTGWSSGSWGSHAEVVALAMNSAAPKPLYNTGAVIEPVDVFVGKEQG